MVNFSLLLALSAAACASAIPTAQAPDTTSATEPFSFSTWIEGIIADPDGTHLTPEEAVAAKQATVNASTSGGLQTRGAAWCRNDFTPANGKDAAACLQQLARKGAKGQQCVIPNGSILITMCIIGGAEVVSSRGTSNGAVQSNCNDVARTGGFIFDGCFRNDGTVTGSDIVIGSGAFQVNILHP